MTIDEQRLNKFEETRAFIQRFIEEPKSSGPLDGLSFAVKDLIDVKGYKTSCGNPHWRDTHPAAAAHAVCVDQLLYAGAKCLGKTATDELAFGLDGENFFFGTPLNPKAPDRVPGGSSSGSASAVASGIVDFALGTDTGGSVRVPASNCGVFGMRPSHGFISVAGVNPLAPSFDTVGMFASNCEILLKVASVLLACDIPTHAEIGAIHLLKESFALSDPEVNEALDEPITLLRKLFPGRIREASLDQIHECFSGIDLRVFYQTYCQIQWAEIWSCLGSWVEENKPEFGPRVKVNFELVRDYDRCEVANALKRRDVYYRALSQFLGPKDLICMPTSPALAPKKGSLGNDRTTCDYYPRTLSMTAVAGIGRLPQITLPLGMSHGVPIGISLLAAHGMDALLLSVCQSAARAYAV